MADDADDEGWDLFWTTIEMTAAIIDGLTGAPVAGSINNGFQALLTAKKDECDGLLPNPSFVSNGHDGARSPTTRNYLKGRKWKSVGSAAVAIAGAAASSTTLVDVGAIVQHSNATGSTLLHLYELAAIAKNYKQSRTISDWIALLVRVKSLKATTRGAQLVGACIPIPAAGAAVGVFGAAMKLGIKLDLTKVCLGTAAEIHWRAFLEQKISGHVTGSKGGPVGPASRIFHEIFTRRGLTRVFGKYQIDALIQEPCGWMALNDKIMLI